MSIRHSDLEKMLPLILRLPVNQHFDVNSDGSLDMQADGQQVNRLRELFPGVIWEKQKEVDLGWWSYTTTFEGVPLKIYADRTGPLSCKKIVETVKETIDVPACEAHQETVTREVIRWECPDDQPR